MSVLGKILAFMNILGVAGVLCLATMDFGKQKVWKYANYRHDLVVFGLPLDDKETSKQSDVLVEDLTDPTLQELFPRGDKVKTQIEEVARVRNLLKRSLDGENDAKKKLPLYSGYLLPMADTNAEREKLVAVRQNLTDPQKADTLKLVLAESIQKGMDIAKPDPKKRSFEEAYIETVRVRGGEPKDVFAEAVLRVMQREGGKKFEDALAQAKDAEAFLQAVRNEPGKAFNDLFTVVYDEALEALRVEFQQRLDGHFVEAYDGKRSVKDPATKKEISKTLLSLSQQKQAVAHLLFNMVEAMPGQEQDKPAGAVVSLWDNPAYRRVITVVGVRAAGTEIEARAIALRAITASLQVALTREQTAFMLAHQDLLDQIRDRAAHVEVQNATLARVKDEADEKEKVLVKRKDDVDYWTAELNAARKESNDRFKELKLMSGELFKIRVQVRDATRLNQEYERQINSLEERVR